MGCVTEMRKRLVKHGNSRALVIDKTILELLRIDDDTQLEISTDGRSLRITPVGVAEERRARLDAALDRIEADYPETLRRLAE
jgi:antitoxin MazE